MVPESIQELRGGPSNAGEIPTAEAGLCENPRHELLPMRLAVAISVLLLFSATGSTQDREPVAGGLASAVIAGRVVTADTGFPIRGAQVRLRSATGGDTRLVITDEQGRFQARNLFTGGWVVTVSKNGFITTRYGQRRSSDEGQPISLNARQRADVAIAMQRAGAITGRVVDEFGEPLLGARIQAMRPRMQNGVRQLAPVGASDTTDDTGSFRVFGLPPGTYFVSSMLRASAPDTDLAQNTLGALTYYPGTADVGEAQGIVLRAGEDLNVAFQSAPVRSVRVTGVVFAANGSPAADTPVRLLRLDGNQVGTTVGNFGQSAADGSFSIINVPPGPYVVVASRMGPLPPRPGDADIYRLFEEAVVPISVSTDDVTGVTVAMTFGTTVNGTVVAEPGSTLPSPLQLEITARQQAAIGRGPAVIAITRTAGQPTDFQLVGLLGAITLSVKAPDGLMLAAIEANGVDVTDKPIELRGNAPEIRIVLSTRVTEISGTVTSGRAPLANASVVVFPEDRGKWAFPSRYVTFADTDEQGRFVIRKLPSRERYFAAVVTALDDGDQFDQELLERLGGRATAFTLGDGERKTLNLAQ